MPRFARKKDGTHDMVADAFRQAGWSVIDTYRAPDCPDFFAASNGRTVAVEVKSKGGKLTASQEKFRQTWTGEYYVVSSVYDVGPILIGRLCMASFGGDGRCNCFYGHSGPHMEFTALRRSEEAQQILGGR